jgi:preprotein translocase subunit YajC
VVVPVNIEKGDELEFEDGSVGTVVEVQAENVVVNVGGRTQTLPAVFEGEIEEE